MEGWDQTNVFVSEKVAIRYSLVETRGKYGGDEGIMLHSGHDVAYGFFNIEACPQEPLVIKCQSNTPTFTDRDGFGVRFWDCFNRYLGTGRVQGARSVTGTEDQNFIKITIRHVFTFTFPASP